MPDSSLLADDFSVRFVTTNADRAAAYRVREIVFQEGQGVPVAIERDSYDSDAIHVLAVTAAGMAVGTARAVERGGGVAKIGRVASLPEWRGRGVGLALMRFLLTLLRERGYTSVFLDAQTPVIGFYERIGFRAEGPEFIEANISHRRMTLSLLSTRT